MKVISKKDTLILLISLPFVVITIVVSLFYFKPIPSSLDKISKSAVNVKRCIYDGTINYLATFELTTLHKSSMKTIMYSPEGETICTSTGMLEGKKQEPCSKYRLCLPIYGN